jgi:hypothetical protein
MTWWVGIAGLEAHWRRQRERLAAELNQPEMWTTPPRISVVIDNPGGRRVLVHGWTGALEGN